MINKLIKSPQELTREITGSQDKFFNRVLSSFVGTALSVSAARVNIPVSSSDQPTTDTLIELAVSATAIGGAAVTAFSVITGIYWGHRHNTLEATRTNLILSGTVPAEAFDITAVQAGQTTQVTQ